VRVHELRYGPGAHPNDRPPARHRLHDDQSEGLAAAGVHECIGRSEPLRQLQAVPPVRNDRHLPTGSRGSAAPDQQQVIRLAEPRHSLAQNPQILLLGESACIHQQPRIIRQCKLAAQVERAARGGEDLGVDTQWLQRRARDAQSREAGAHRATRGQHEIEMRVSRTQVAPRGLADDTAEAASQQLHQIGVKKRYQRNVAISCHARGAERRVERITDLDEIRFQCRQHRAPARLRQRQSIVESPWQPHTWNSADATDLELQGGSGDQQGMTMRRVRSQP